MRISGKENRGSFEGVKRQEREVNHTPPSSAEVKNKWSYTSTLPTYDFMAWIRKNFAFL
jgi:hypothetical protein